MVKRKAGSVLKPKHRLAVLHRLSIRGYHGQQHHQAKSLASKNFDLNLTLIIVYRSGEKENFL